MVKKLENKLVWLLLFMYLFINDLFLIKYLPSLSLKPVVIVVYSICIVFLFLWKDKIKYWNTWNKEYLILAAFPLIFFLYFKIPPLAVTSDRWSALYYWSENLSRGIYPYAAHTHMGGFGSPFPTWQIFHFPFYLMHDEIFAHFTMLIVLLFFLRKNKSIIVPATFIVLLLLSPAYWWEVAVRSDLMNNMLVSMMLIVLLEKHRSWLSTRPLLVGLITGLICCSRIFLFKPFLLYILPSIYGLGRKKTWYIFMGWFLGFLLPFVPFLFWNAQMLLFFKYSPIVLQIRQGSVITFSIGLIAISIVSFFWKNMYQYFVLTASFLFLFITMMFVRKSIEIGLLNAVFLDGFDLSYFGIAIPFLLVAASFRSKEAFIKKSEYGK